MSGPSGVGLALAALEFALDGFAQQVRTLFAIIKNGVHPFQCAFRQSRGNLLMIDLFSTHAQPYLISGNLTSLSECDII